MNGGVHIGPGAMVLDKYRVERVIGHGGMGFVVAARHVALDQLFAIKVMRPSFAEDLEAQQRFLREARAAAKLEGDHVARVQDVGCLPDGTSYMVMEYLAGEDLKKVVRKSGALPVSKVVEYALQACEALREAHGLGIVHRDVKPANLMLVPRPDGAARIKVIDFGISKHVAEAASGITSNDWTAGSPSYMAPEQMRSARNVDVRADVWSMGVVLYELLTGVTPFHATSVPAVMHRVLNEKPVPPCLVRESIPAALGDAVMRCLEKRPEKRFQTIDELAKALRAAARGEATVQLPEVLRHQGDAQGPAPARRSCPSIPCDRHSFVASPEVATAVETPRPSTTSLGFGHVASVPLSRWSGAMAPNKLARRAASVLALATLCAVGAGAFWLRLGPAPAVAEVTSRHAAAPGTAPSASREAPEPAAPASAAPAAPAETVALPPAPAAIPGAKAATASLKNTLRMEPARPLTRAAAAPPKRKHEPLY